MKTSIPFCYTGLPMVTLLLFVAVLLLVFVAWEVAGLKPRESEVDRIHRELLENLRRELLDAKDKLHDGMGRNAESIQQRLEKTLELVNKQLSGMDDRIDKRVSEINQRLDAAAKLMSLVSKQYGTVEELSGAIKQLHEAFRAPKLRGGFGEKTLVDLVRQVLPIKSYVVQHTFRSGEKVDLLVKTADGAISIDAKFPLENYLKLTDQPQDEETRRAFRTDVKKHIRDIAKKYILPDEGTLEFALMYMPSEALWHDIVNDAELADLAQSLHVFVLSPQSFYYFLNVIRLAYQSQQFEENAKQVLSLLRGIEQQSGKLGADLQILQRHLGNAATKMGDVQMGYGKLDMQITQAGQLGLVKGQETPPFEAVQSNFLGEEKTPTQLTGVSVG
jgi:DNA recombination protein RmuC